MRPSPQAWITSKGALGDEWPREGMTLEDGRVECAWHEEEFKTRASFTYAVMSPDETRELGCVYIVPSMRVGFDAQVLLWVKRSEYEKGLDQQLFDVVKKWIAEAWPFIHVAYPGREMSWGEWKQIPYKY